MSHHLNTPATCWFFSTQIYKLYFYKVLSLRKNLIILCPFGKKNHHSGSCPPLDPHWMLIRKVSERRRLPADICQSHIWWQKRWFVTLSWHGQAKYQFQMVQFTQRALGYLLPIRYRQHKRYQPVLSTTGRSSCHLSATESTGHSYPNDRHSHQLGISAGVYRYPCVHPST